MMTLITHRNPRVTCRAQEEATTAPGPARTGAHLWKARVDPVPVRAAESPRRSRIVVNGTGSSPQHGSRMSPPAGQALMLRRLLEREREKANELTAAHAQLQAYAADVRRVYDAGKARARELEHAYRETLLRLIRASEFKHKETGAHVKRIAHYSRILAELLGFDAEQTALLVAAAPLHDVGKLGIPDAVLLKHGPLSPDEWAQMRAHTTMGAQLLANSQSPLIELARIIALTHHEHWDGTGYPQGLSGDQIPLVGRIVMLADQYDALRHERSYKPPYTHLKAVETLLRGDQRTRPEHFDPRLLDLFRHAHRDFERIHNRLGESAEDGTPGAQRETRHGAHAT